MNNLVLFALAKNAGFSVKQDQNEIFSPYREEYGIEELLEEFAEILIKECLTIVAQEGSWEAGATNAFNRIANEFGIDNCIYDNYADVED